MTVTGQVEVFLARKTQIAIVDDDPSDRDSDMTLAISTVPLPVILAVEYHVAEQEMASILFFCTIFSAISLGGFIWLTA